MNNEIFGTVGTMLVLIGFLTNSEKKIRMFNVVGSVFFVVYGILISAYSTIALNGVLIFIHIAKIWKLKKVV